MLCAWIFTMPLEDAPDVLARAVPVDHLGVLAEEDTEAKLPVDEVAEVVHVEQERPIYRLAQVGDGASP